MRRQEVPAGEEPRFSGVMTLNGLREKAFRERAEMNARMNDPDPTNNISRLPFDLFFTEKFYDRRLIDEQDHLISVIERELAARGITT